MESHTKTTNDFLSYLFLTFACLGAVVPWYFNIRQLQLGTPPFTLYNYFAAGFANNFAASITTDFFIGTTPVLVWMIIEGRKLGMKRIWWYVPATFLISFAFTCPLFFYFRQKALTERGTE